MTQRPWTDSCRPAVVIPMVLAASLAACTPSIDEFFGTADDFMTVRTPPERLREIEEVRLEDQSRTPPVPVDDAAAEALDRASVERPEPPARLDLTLPDVRAAALAHNLDLKVDLVSPAIAQATVDEEEAKFESTFRASARHQQIDSPTDVATEGSRIDIDTFDLGVEVPLRTGGTINVNLPMNRTATNNIFALLDPAYETDVRFSISQPLLRNAGAKVNTQSIVVARYEEQIAESQTKLEAIRILANADRAYWRLYAARRELEVAQQQYELAVAQLEQAQRKVNAGDAPEIEVTRAESGVATRIEAIIVADTVVRQRERDLLRIMNRPDAPMGSETALIPGTAPQPVDLDLDGDALADRAVANRMEMLELELRLAIDASTIDLTRNARLPLVTLDYTYNPNGLGEDYRDAFGDIADRSFETWTVGLNAEIPLGNERAKARYHRAVLRRIQRLATRAQRELAIRQEVYDALDQLEQNWRRILAARQEVILAGRTYEGEQRQFQVGIRTSTDVLDAATRLAAAQSREIQALTDYQVAQVDIAFATGTLLGMERVRWEPVVVPRD